MVKCIFKDSAISFKWDFRKIKLTWNDVYTSGHIYLCILKLNSPNKSFLEPHYYTQSHCPLSPDRNIRLYDQIMTTQANKKISSVSIPHAW